MKTKGPRSDALRKDLSRLIGGAKVKTEPEDLLAYSSDATRYYAQGKPEAVVLAASVDNVSKVVKYASDYEIPGVTPARSGKRPVRGHDPMQGGIVLDTKRMNKILEINKGNMIARAECGVVPSSFLYDKMPHIGTQTDGHEARTL